jgi:hypothetical protein
MTIAKTPNHNNGARSKILRALYQHGMMPITELSEYCGLTGKQARDNVGAARVDQLLSTERDDVTGLCAYKITATGRKWVEERANLLKDETDTGTATAEESLAVEAAESPMLSPPADPIEVDTGPPLIGIFGTEPAYGWTEDSCDDTIYVCRTEGGLFGKCASKLHAIEGAKHYAKTTGTRGEAYRLVKIGETRTTIEFVEDPE